MFPPLKYPNMSLREGRADGGGQTRCPSTHDNHLFVLEACAVIISVREAPHEIQGAALLGIECYRPNGTLEHIKLLREETFGFVGRRRSGGGGSAKASRIPFAMSSMDHVFLPAVTPNWKYWCLKKNVLQQRNTTPSRQGERARLPCL